MSEHVHEVAIVGSGFSGLAMAKQLKDAGIEDFVILERARDVGGTWRDNSYPGCACDVPSHLYSFSFELNPDWSSTFSPQEEIQAYIRRTAEKHGLTPHVRYGHELEEARWDDEAQCWRLRTGGGDMSARSLVGAQGALSEPKIPQLPGLDRFQGRSFHSATWDHDHDLSGERVAVIGTGASAIQFVPQIQPDVDKLHLFQRTPPWIMPRPDRPLTRFERVLYKRIPATQRLMREAIYWGRELYAIPMLRAALARVIKPLALRHLRKQVADPELRAKLTPDYQPGCKRILVSNDYLPSLTQPNVEVVCDGVAEIRENSIVDSNGVEREVDTIIFGTGFQVTEFPVGHRVLDRHGRSLADYWDGSPEAHRGTTIAGFPNLFFLLGPNTGLGHTSALVMIEAQAAYATKIIERLRAGDVAAIEPRAEAQVEYNADIQSRLQGTVWNAGGCASWYLDRNGRNSTIWPDFTFRFRRELRELDESEYVLTPVREPAPVEVAA